MTVWLGRVTILDRGIGADGVDMATGAEDGPGVTTNEVDTEVAL